MIKIPKFHRINSLGIASAKLPSDKYQWTMAHTIVSEGTKLTSH